VLFGLAVLAAQALALATAVDRPIEHNGYVWVDVRLNDLLAPRVRESLGRGMPATLTLHSELWRRRSGWFDRLEEAYDATIRVRYEVWNRTFRVERAGQPPVTVGGLDSVSLALAGPFAVRAGRVGTLRPGARYYVVVSTTLKPLSVEDVAEVEGWLSGEVADKRRAGIGVITELPRALFDAVRNFSGFGDQRSRAVSEDFELSDLFADR
jgi:hypothetical protein